MVKQVGPKPGVCLWCHECIHVAQERKMMYFIKRFLEVEKCTVKSLASIRETGNLMGQKNELIRS